MANQSDEFDFGDSFSVQTGNQTLGQQSLQSRQAAQNMNNGRLPFINNQGGNPMSMQQQNMGRNMQFAQQPNDPLEQRLNEYNNQHQYEGDQVYEGQDDDDERRAQQVVGPSPSKTGG